MPHQPASAALSRFRVIDLTQVRAGPTACRQLADWGADVVQVQMPEHMRGDDTLGGQEGSDYQYTHRNKRSITLNLKEPEGIALLKQLIAKADVVVENWRPDVKDRLGLDYASLKAINPRIILASISGFGEDGPYRDRPGFDQIAQLQEAHAQSVIASFWSVDETANGQIVENSVRRGGVKTGFFADFFEADGLFFGGQHLQQVKHAFNHLDGGCAGQCVAAFGHGGSPFLHFTR